MWGGLSIGYTYPPLRAESLKARETDSRSVRKKEYIFLEYIYNVFIRCESHPVVTMDRLGPRQVDGLTDGLRRAQSLGGVGRSPDGDGGQIGDRQGWAPGPDRPKGDRWVDRWMGR